MEGALEHYSLPALSISNCVTLKLTERNYILWKSQFESFLSSQSLLSFVDSSAPPPSSTLNVPGISGLSTPVRNPDYDPWFRCDQLVRSWLLGSLSEDVLNLVIGCNTSAEVWKSLSNHFNRTSSSRLFELQRRLQTMSKNNKPVTDYLRDFKVVCDQLSSIGHPVTEKMKIFGILQGLGREYESFTTVIESFMDDAHGPSYEDVVSRLQGFEDRIKSYADAPDVSPHVAFNTSRFTNSYDSGFRGRGNYAPRGGFRGGYYRGNYNRGGYFRGRSSFSTRGRGFHQQISHRAGSNDNNNAYDSSACQICGRFGHSALRCWNRFDNNYQFEEPPTALAAQRFTDVTDHHGQEWFPDTGATAHVTNTPKNLQQSQPYTGSDSVMVGDGNFLPITHMGSVNLPSSSGNLPLQEVLVCPAITKSLLSVSKLTSEFPCIFEFDAHGVCVKDKVTKKVLTVGQNRSGLYVLEDASFTAFYSSRQRTASDEVWHYRLGHPNPQILQQLASRKLITINKTSGAMCESCKLGKSSRLSFLPSTFVATKPLERIHCDLWGPAPVLSKQGFRYYVIFVDHFSRFSWFYPLRLKSEFMSAFVKFQSLVQTQLNTKIKVFQCDGAGEFTSNQFLSLLQSCGIAQHISCPHTAQQNGLAERKHRHITELGLSMLFHAKLPQSYWLEAFFTANFLSNLLPTSTSDENISAYETLNSQTPDYQSLRVFGCSAYPCLRDYSSNKLDPRSLKCVFLGYNERYKGYRCLYPPTGRVYISRHVVFDESEFPFYSTYQHLQEQPQTGLYRDWLQSFAPVLPDPIPPSTQPVDTQGTVIYSRHQNVQTTSAPTTVTSPTRHQQITQTTPSVSAETEHVEQTIETMVVPPTNSTLVQPLVNQHPMVTRAKMGIHKPNPRYVLLTQKVSNPEPQTVTSALKNPGWKSAMQEELKSLSDTKTWTLVPYTKGMNVLGSKWVFKTKLNADGTLDKLKARLVAKGFDQEEGIDYIETFSPVVKSATVRIILHLATVMNWDIKQLDVKNAFLHGDLTETVFMMQPAGFVDKSRSSHVCHLHKSIYGLKQSPRAWFDKFSDYLLEYGFMCSKADPSMFVFRSSSDIILLLLYVDDMVVTGSNSNLLTKLLQDLGKNFCIKDLGNLHYFLGIQVHSQSHGMFLSQQKYAEDLLVIAGMNECAPMPSPLPVQLDNLAGRDEQFSDPTYFRSLAGKLQYLTLTRPDIQFSVNYVCQKMHSPSLSDYHLLKRILRYVKGTLNFGITFSKDTNCVLRGYSDSDWAGCKESRRSTGGYCTFLGKNLISWSAKKQPTVSRSSTEAEYRALASAAAEITWISSVLRDISVPQLSPAEIYCDNISSVYLSANPALHSRTKHIDVDYHYVREKVALGSLLIKHISAENQLADVFTKSLPITPFLSLRFKLGVDCLRDSSLRGDVRQNSCVQQKGTGLEQRWKLLDQDQRKKSEAHPQSKPRSEEVENRDHPPQHKELSTTEQTKDKGCTKDKEVLDPNNRFAILGTSNDDY